MKKSVETIIDYCLRSKSVLKLA